MSFDKIFDLTARAYFNFDNISIPARVYMRRKTQPSRQRFQRLRKLLFSYLGRVVFLGIEFSKTLRNIFEVRLLVLVDTNTSTCNVYRRIIERNASIMTRRLYPRLVNAMSRLAR